MPICLWGFPRIGVKLYTGDTGGGEYGSNSEPVPGNRGYVATGEYGWNKFHIYLPGDRYHIERVKKCGATGRKNVSSRSIK